MIDFSVGTIVAAASEVESVALRTGQAQVYVRRTDTYIDVFGQLQHPGIVREWLESAVAECGGTVQHLPCGYCDSATVLIPLDQYERFVRLVNSEPLEYCRHCDHSLGSACSYCHGSVFERYP